MFRVQFGGTVEVFSAIVEGYVYWGTRLPNIE